MRKVLFRSSVNGYNKKDVNEYIASTDARHAEELAQAERRIAELEAELETSKSAYEMKISGLEEENLRTKQEAIDSEKKLTETKASSSLALASARNDTAAARQKSEELKKKLMDAEACIKRQNDEVKRLRDCCTSAEAALPDADELAELRRRAAAYDELEAKRLTLPQAGIEAEAENVIQSARTEAASIRRDAQRDNAEALEETKKQVSGELAEIYAMIHRTAAEAMEEILACMRTAEEGVGKLGEQLSDKNRDAVARVDSMRSELEEMIEKRLDEAQSRIAEAESKSAPVPAAAAGQPIGAEKKSEEKKPVAAAERSVAKTAERHDRSAASRRTQNNGIFRFGRRK